MPAARMGLDPARLRRGELIVGAGALVLLASMFLLPWYGLESPFRAPASTRGLPSSVDGWHGLSHLRWLLLLTIVAALGLVYLQVSRRSPAIPASMSVIVTVLGGLCALALVYRVLINVPGADDLLGQRVGAYVGLISAIAIAYGGYESMRKEGISDRDGPSEIATVRLGSPGGS